MNSLLPVGSEFLIVWTQSSLNWNTNIIKFVFSGLKHWDQASYSLELQDIYLNQASVDGWQKPFTELWQNCAFSVKPNNLEIVHPCNDFNWFSTIGGSFSWRG